MHQASVTAPEPLRAGGNSELRLETSSESRAIFGPQEMAENNWVDRDVIQSKDPPPPMPPPQKK